MKDRAVSLAFLVEIGIRPVRVKDACMAGKLPVLSSGAGAEALMFLYSDAKNVFFAEFSQFEAKQREAGEARKEARRDSATIGLATGTIASIVAEIAKPFLDIRKTLSDTEDLALLGTSEIPTFVPPVEVGTDVAFSSQFGDLQVSSARPFSVVAAADGNLDVWDKTDHPTVYLQHPGRLSTTYTAHMKVMRLNGPVKQGDVLGVATYCPTNKEIMLSFGFRQDDGEGRSRRLPYQQFLNPLTEDSQEA